MTTRAILAALVVALVAAACGGGAQMPAADRAGEPTKVAAPAKKTPRPTSPSAAAAPTTDEPAEDDAITDAVEDDASTDDGEEESRDPATMLRDAFLLTAREPVAAVSSRIVFREDAPGERVAQVIEALRVDGDAIATFSDEMPTEDGGTELRSYATAILLDDVLYTDAVVYLDAQSVRTPVMALPRDPVDPGLADTALAVLNSARIADPNLLVPELRTVREVEHRGSVPDPAGGSRLTLLRAMVTLQAVIGDVPEVADDVRESGRRMTDTVEYEVMIDEEGRIRQVEALLELPEALGKITQYSYEGREQPIPLPDPDITTFLEVDPPDATEQA